MPRIKLFFFFLAEDPGFWVVVFLAGTGAAGRLRAGRAVVGGGGAGVGVKGAGRGVLGSRLSPDCTMRFIHFSNAVLTKFSSSSSSSTATPGPSAPGSCRRRLVASRTHETAVGSVARLGRRPDWDRLTGVSFWPPSARPDSIRHCWSIRPCTTARSPAVPSWATRSSLP